MTGTSVGRATERGIDVVQALGGLSTATLSDALDRLGLPGSAHGLSPLATGQRMAGRAFTVRYVPVGAEPGSVGDYLDDVAPGQVVVLDNAGRTACTVWGDILTAVAHRRGIAGTVVFGVCRDVARALGAGYPVYSSGRFMRTGKDRVTVAGVNERVSVGDASAGPGDVVVGDDDGVVVVAAGHEQRVLDVALEIADREHGIVEDALAGMSIGEARARHGYHTLQRRSDP